MKRRLFSVLAALGLVVALAGPAYAYDHTNYAGRPTGNAPGIGGLSCEGIAYGLVDGQSVLFMPNHCNPRVTRNDPGAMQYGTSGIALGHWAYYDYGLAGDDDFSYIFLYDGQKPYIKNEIYRGLQPGGTPDHWTVTVPYPSSTLNCAGLVSKLGRSAYQMWQASSSSTTQFGIATMLNEVDQTSDHCLIQTDMAVHTSGAPDSGTPWVYGALTNQPVGFSTDAVYYSNYIERVLRFSSFYEGWALADAYWRSHGTGSGVQLCYDSACTAY